MSNFYSSLDARYFWRSGVANISPLANLDIYKKKWDIDPSWEIGTAGSCFAQHIARFMKKNGYNVLDAEPAPRVLANEKHHNYGYSLYSGRYGNIYTTRQFLQLIQEAFSPDPENFLIWENEGRFYDALRPNIEPNGFASRDELIAIRNYHLERLRILFKNVDMFVFTLGLTEAWAHKNSGRVVPIAPGVIAGGDEIEDYEFVNFTYTEVVDDFSKAMKAISAHRTKPLHYMLTVSPVPLTATASGNHVLSASTYSKSVLRSAAGFLSETHENIDYFPSYEIITNPASRAIFYAPNLRSVTDEGVNVVMKTFFSEHPRKAKVNTRSKAKSNSKKLRDLQCEEALLEAFDK
ncbi:GSCFA domain-containing protein [Falsihalocynthiibacter sp. SS001]|uniref:GSCFA domain-containing protein n=1 Tax=Falsihalocynthiibacter sp. SS001 TaxID=3349698 RepID=UPI0036D35D97